MEVGVVLLTLICYGVALYLWWSQQMPIFLLVLVAGHIGALASPLWVLLYDVSYRSDLTVMASFLGQPLYTPIFIASAWFYGLPAMVVFYLYYARWWSAGYVTGLITFGIFLFYHTVLESLGRSMNLWSYSNVLSLPFGMSEALLSTIMAALISLLLLYVLLLVRRFSLVSLALLLLPVTLLSNLLVRGLLGAPLWVAQLFGMRDWMITIGTFSTLLLLVWALHIVAWGLSRIEWEVA